MEHPDLGRELGSGYDFAQQGVRVHYLAFVGELMQQYDCDGIELDWMRFPEHVKRTLAVSRRLLHAAVKSPAAS